jgi:hypothetical protein
MTSRIATRNFGELFFANYVKKVINPKRNRAQELLARTIEHLARIKKDAYPLSAHQYKTIERSDEDYEIIDIIHLSPVPNAIIKKLMLKLVLDIKLISKKIALLDRCAKEPAFLIHLLQEQKARQRRVVSKNH